MQFRARGDLDPLVSGEPGRFDLSSLEFSIFLAELDNFLTDVEQHPS